MIRTGGGTFDPDARHVYFLAASLDRQQVGGAVNHDHVLVAVNELPDLDAAGEARERIDFIEEAMERGVKVLLDSGIFWLANTHARVHNMRMDDALALAPDEIDGFGPLFDKYVATVTRWQELLWGYIELDQGGAKNKRRTRARLQDLGLRPIPVYHPFNDGWDYFDELAETHDRMCFGNVVQADQQTRKRLVATAWERHRAYPELWIHLLGLTPNDWLHAFPCDSADSSTWLNVVRWHGHKPSAMLRTFGSELPDDFMYQLGQREGRGGAIDACLLSAAAAHFDQAGAQAHRAVLDEVFGPAYPKRTRREGALRPGTVRDWETDDEGDPE